MVINLLEFNNLGCGADLQVCHSVTVFAYAFRHFEVCTPKAGGVEPVTAPGTEFIQLTVKGLDCDPLCYFFYLMIFLM